MKCWSFWLYYFFKNTTFLPQKVHTEVEGEVLEIMEAILMDFGKQ